MPFTLNTVMKINVRVCQPLCVKTEGKEIPQREVRCVQPGRKERCLDLGAESCLRVALSSRVHLSWSFLTFGPPLSPHYPSTLPSYLTWFLRSLQLPSQSRGRRSRGQSSATPEADTGSRSFPVLDPLISLFWKAVYFLSFPFVDNIRQKK